MRADDKTDEESVYQKLIETAKMAARPELDKLVEEVIAEFKAADASGLFGEVSCSSPS